MKKIFSILMVAMMAISSVMAQDKLKFENVLNNRFGDNWEVSLAGGHTFSAYKGWGQGPFMDNFGWNVEATATKWFNPVVGMRLQVASGQVEARTAKSWMITPHADHISVKRASRADIRKQRRAFLSELRRSEKEGAKKAALALKVTSFLKKFKRKP